MSKNTIVKKLWDFCENITQNNRICYIFELNYYKNKVLLQNYSEFCNSTGKRFAEIFEPCKLTAVAPPPPAISSYCDRIECRIL